MLSPNRLFRMMTEFIFILLGGVLVWLGLNNRFFVASAMNSRRLAWLGLGAALIFWGVRAWVKTARAARTADRMVMRIGGASLVLVGFMMVGLVVFKFQWMGVGLAVAGGILALRGFVAAVLSLRTD